jgi:hypothetical protein
MAEFKIIRGGDTHQQMVSVDNALQKMQKQVYSRIAQAYLYPTGMSFYLPEVAPDQEFAQVMCPAAGKLIKVLMHAEAIDKIPGEKAPIAVVTVTIEGKDLGAWLGTICTLGQDQHAQVSGKSIEVYEGCRMKISFSRHAVGVWLCYIIEPIPYPITVELAEVKE